jgi:pimeloyl-ACP methyl ester carboxylesterase
VKESIAPVAENKNPIPQEQKETRYAGGNVSYSVFGSPDPESQKILVIPGFTEDSLTMQGFAEALTEDGRRQVIVTDQPSYGFKKGITMSAIDHQAEANLAVIRAEGLDNEPLAVVAHSLGAPVEVRMAELAEQSGITALDADKGSVSVFLAPAGANKDERLLLSKDSLGARFVLKFMARDAKENKKYDAAKTGQKRAAKNFIKNPLKTGKEAWFLSKKESTYKKLGSLGLKPSVVVFSDDVLQPQRLDQKITDAYVDGTEDYSLNGWSTAVNIAGKGVGDKAAEDAWLDDYRRAGHNDHARHPEHVAEVVLAILDNQDGSAQLKRIIQADKTYLEAKARVP